MTTPTADATAVGGEVSAPGVTTGQSRKQQCNQTFEYVCERTYTHMIDNGPTAQGATLNVPYITVDEGWQILPYNWLKPALTEDDLIRINTMAASVKIEEMSFKIFNFTPLQEAINIQAGTPVISNYYDSHPYMMMMIDRDHDLDQYYFYGKTNLPVFGNAIDWCNNSFSEPEPRVPANPNLIHSVFNLSNVAYAGPTFNPNTTSSGQGGAWGTWTTQDFMDYEFLKVGEEKIHTWKNPCPWLWHNTSGFTDSMSLFYPDGTFENPANIQAWPRAYNELTSVVSGNAYNMHWLSNIQNIYLSGGDRVAPGQSNEINNLAIPPMCYLKMNYQQGPNKEVMVLKAAFKCTYKMVVKFRVPKYNIQRNIGVGNTGVLGTMVVGYNRQGVQDRKTYARQKGATTRSRAKEVAMRNKAYADAAHMLKASPHPEKEIIADDFEMCDLSVADDSVNNSRSTRFGAGSSRTEGAKERR